MRNLLALCTTLAVALAGACVSFDPSGQPMNDDAVDPEAEVDAGTADTAPDAEVAPTPPDAATIDPDAEPEEEDSSGPGHGHGGH